MIGIEISAGFDSFPANGETCCICKEIIEGAKYVLYIQVGPATEAIYIEDSPFCETCSETRKDSL